MQRPTGHCTFCTPSRHVVTAANTTTCLVLSCPVLLPAAVVPAAGCSAGGGGCTGSNCNPPPTTLTEAVITGGPYTMACPGSTVLDASQSTAFDGNTAALSYSWAFYNAASGQGFVLDAGNQATYQLLLSSQAEMQLGETWSVEVTVTDSQGECCLTSVCTKRVLGCLPY